MDCIEGLIVLIAALLKGVHNEAVTHNSTLMVQHNLAQMLCRNIKILRYILIRVLAQDPTVPTWYRLPFAY